MKPYPRAFSHIGLTVGDIDRAVEFYTTVLGCYLIVPPTEIRPDGGPASIQCRDVFGGDWQGMKIAHLATSDRVGIELFEFPGSYYPDDKLEYRKIGIFHFCVQDPDVEGLVESITAHGGRQRMPVREFYPRKPYRMVYCEDPFGNIIEIYSHSYELIFGHGYQPADT